MAGLQGGARAYCEPGNDIIAQTYQEQEGQVQGMQDHPPPLRGRLHWRGAGEVQALPEDGGQGQDTGEGWRHVDQHIHHQGGLLRLRRRKQRSHHGADEQVAACAWREIHDTSAERLQGKRDHEHVHRLCAMRPFPHRHQLCGCHQRVLCLFPCQGKLQR